MTDYGSAWDAAGRDDDDYDAPNGRYRARIAGGETYSGNDGREWCKVYLEIVSPAEHVGRVIEDWGPAGDHNRVGFRIMRTRLILYGLDPEGIASLDELGDRLAALTGREIEFSVSHNDKGFRQINVSSSTAGDSVVPMTAASATGPSPTDDDIPF